MEIELKFQLPESKKKSVLQFLNKQSAQKFVCKQNTMILLIVY